VFTSEVSSSGMASSSEPCDKADDLVNTVLERCGIPDIINSQIFTRSGIRS
jgi:hypothetical protein